MSSYETAIARMFALGHELAQMPSHKFDLAHMRVLLAALDNPERQFPQRADCRDERQGIDRGDPGFDPAGFGAANRALYLAPPGADQ